EWLGPPAQTLVLITLVRAAHFSHQGSVGRVNGQSGAKGPQSTACPAGDRLRPAAGLCEIVREAPRYCTPAPEVNHHPAVRSRATLLAPSAGSCCTPRNSTEALALPSAVARRAARLGRGSGPLRLCFLVAAPEPLDHRRRLRGGAHRQRRPAIGLRAHRP